MTLLAELHAEICAECPATIEDGRRDPRSTRCLELYCAGRLPI